MKAKPRLLIVEDDDLQYEIYEETLSGYELIRVRRGSDALALLPKTPPDALVLDHILEDGERGLDFLPEFKEVLPHVPDACVQIFRPGPGPVCPSGRADPLESSEESDVVSGPCEARGWRSPDGNLQW